MSPSQVFLPQPWEIMGTWCVPPAWKILKKWHLSFKRKRSELNIEYHKWYSERLNQDMEMKVYGHAGKPVLVFPSQAGRFL